MKATSDGATPLNGHPARTGRPTPDAVKNRDALFSGLEPSVIYPPLLITPFLEGGCQIQVERLEKVPNSCVTRNVLTFVDSPFNADRIEEWNEMAFHHEFTIVNTHTKSGFTIAVVGNVRSYPAAISGDVTLSLAAIDPIEFNRLISDPTSVKPTDNYRYQVMQFDSNGQFPKNGKIKGSL